MAARNYTVESGMRDCMDVLQKRLDSVGQLRSNVEAMKREVEAMTEESQWDRRMARKADIRKLEKEIEKIEGGEMVDFLLDAMPIVSKYTNAVNARDAKKRKKDATGAKTGAQVGAKDPDSADVKRGALYRDFMDVVVRYPCLPHDPKWLERYGADERLDNMEFSFCEKCQVNMVEGGGSVMCSKCGKSVECVSSGIEAFPYGTPISTTDYCYKRINHFNETLAQFHARERSIIPREVIDAVANEFKKARMTDKSSITPANVRAFLRKLKMAKFFEHAVQITHTLSGTPPPTMTLEQEERLRTMFRMVQKPFEEVCPKDRKNFLNYSYCLHKMCQLLEYDEFLPHFPLLKSKEKLWEQDEIWKEICKKLNWQFIPSK